MSPHSKKQQQRRRQTKKNPTQATRVAGRRRAAQTRGALASGISAQVFCRVQPKPCSEAQELPSQRYGTTSNLSQTGNLATASPRLPRTESRSSPHGAPATRDQSPQLSAPRPPHLCPCRAFHVERPPSSPPGACLLDTVHKVFQIQHPARWPLCYFLPSARSRLRFLN